MYWSLAFISTFAVYGILSPYISVLIRGYGWSHTVVGMVLAVCEGAAIISPFITGYFADKLGRYRPVILLSLAMTFVCGAGLFFSKNLVLCAILIPVLAFGYRSLQPLMDAVSTINLGKDGNYGKYRTVGSIIFFSLVIFFQTTTIFRPNTPKNIAFWISAISFVSTAILFFIPVSYFTNNKVSANQSKAEITKNNSVSVKHGAFRKLWSPLFILGFAIIFINRLAMSPVQGFISLYAIEDLNWDAVGLMWALSSGSEIPFIFLSKRIIKRFGALPLIAFSTAAVGVRLLIYVVFPFKAGVIAAQCMHSLCYGIFHPAAVAFISQCVPPEQRALGMSLYLSLGTGVPTLIGNFIGGFIVETYGFRMLFGIFAALALPGLILYFSTRRFMRNEYTN
ncbi:MFS metabolite transporter [Spirochaetia bacterium]|nr:MFS metabolite transporter [Spirochaetia bacterium]